MTVDTKFLIRKQLNIKINEYEQLNFEKENYKSINFLSMLRTIVIAQNLISNPEVVFQVVATVYDIRGSRIHILCRRFLANERRHFVVKVA